MAGTPRQTKPFGTWPSPISAGSVAEQSLRFAGICADGGRVYWSQSRPAEGGRLVVMRCRPGDEPEDILPAPFSARSRVHEYGGGAFLAVGDTLFFVNDEDQDVYRLRQGSAPERLTSEPAMRFADMCLDANHSRLIAVCERHTMGDNHVHPENSIVQISLGSPTLGDVREIVGGHDFFAYPSLSPDGRKLAYLAWDLPDMPWDSATLFLATFDENGAIALSDRIAGGPGSAVFQPEWSGGGELIFVSDESGWGNFYCYADGATRQLTGTQVEFSQPLWNLGIKYYAFLGSGEIAAVYVDEGQYRLGRIDPASGEMAPVETELCSFQSVASDGHDIFAIGATHTSQSAIFHISLENGRSVTLSKSAKSTYPAELLSKPAVMEFENAAGQSVFGLYYPPTSDTCQGPGNEKPPVILNVHGGPTSSVNRGLNLKVQFWTTRGFAFFDIDYSGSTGYGRAYRERLDGRWGEADVADCIAGARFLASSGRADPAKMVISGGSAGGFTVLATLAASDIFAAGACYYGVADLLQLLKITHKFEAGYLYRLLGLSQEDDDAAFNERSPLYHVEKIDRPVIFFQGMEDKVVPPSQTRDMAVALKERRVPVFYLEFSGEGHGFRRAETIKKALEYEHAFYAHVLKLDVPDLPADLDSARN